MCFTTHQGQHGSLALLPDLPLLVDLLLPGIHLRLRADLLLRTLVTFIALVAFVAIVTIFAFAGHHGAALAGRGIAPSASRAVIITDAR